MYVCMPVRLLNINCQLALEQRKQKVHQMCTNTALRILHRWQRGTIHKHPNVHRAYLMGAVCKSHRQRICICKWDARPGSPSSHQNPTDSHVGCQTNPKVKKIWSVRSCVSLGHRNYQACNVHCRNRPTPPTMKYK